MRGVTIQPLDNPRISEKGSAYTLSPYNIEAFAIYYRNKGVVAGKHYHTGSDPMKNPEQLILIRGKIRLTVRDLVTKATEVHEVIAPARWTIAPNIYHEAECLEDCIYLEPRSAANPEGIGDTIKI